MHRLSQLQRLALAWLGAALGALAAGCVAMAPATSGVQRLYVLYCGEAQIPDVSPWSPGVNVGQAAVFSVNCYLIRHGTEWMLWDSGYPDSLVEKPEGIVGPRSRALRSKTLVSQLAEIGVAPNQISRLAFSHFHGDHVGNADLFSTATLYIQKPEYDAAFGAEPAKYGFAPATYERLRASRIVKLEGDFDVFGDGSVVVLSTPGHTPGHQSLLVKLPKTGALVLSGDAVHFKSNWENRGVPSGNTDKDKTLASMQRISEVLAKEKAQLWINHDKAQRDSLKMAPAYYD